MWPLATIMVKSDLAQTRSGASFNLIAFACIRQLQVESVVSVPSSLDSQ